MLEVTPGASTSGRLVTVGILGGLLSGLLGVGGGIIMVPLLVYWAKYEQRYAHALSLGAIIPISLVGAATFGVAGRVQIADGVALALGARSPARAVARFCSRGLMNAY